MGGPIVRSGASPEFSKNWDRIFGGAVTKQAKPSKKAKAAPAKKQAAAVAQKSAKPKKAAKKKTR